MNTAKAEICSALKYVLDNCGIGVFSDVRRVNAFLLDLAPKKDSEREIIRTVLLENTANEIIIAYGQTENVKEQIFSECFKKLKDKTELEEDEIVFAVNALSECFGISYYLPERKIVTPSRILRKGDIPTNAERLDDYFKGCTEISYKALSCNTSVQNVVIPETVKQIKSKAFFGCINLKQVIIPHTTEQIGVKVFEGCNSLERITVQNNPRYKNENGMLTDSRNHELIRAVNGNMYKHFAIPEGINKISAYAFENSSAETIAFPPSLKEISLKAFVNCKSLETFIVSKLNRVFSAYDGVVYSRDARVLIQYPQGSKNTGYIIENSTERISERAFYGAIYLENVTFTSSLKTIGAQAFSNSEKLRSVVLPNSVISVGERAFENCISIQNVMLPKGIEEIGDMSFKGCTSLVSVSIPQTVQRIGHGAFMNCRNLSRIVIQEKLSFIGDDVFTGCADNLEIYGRNNPYAEIYCKSHNIKYIIV